MILGDLVARSAERAPDAVAVRAEDGVATYGELDRWANQMAHALAELDVHPGDRVGIWMEKSIRAVVAMQAVSRLAAVYVPLDPASPAARIRTILRDCHMRALVTTAERAPKVLTEELASLPRLVLDPEGWAQLQALPATEVSSPRPAEDALAYILYTSGSTGVPKGVCISHRNALAFIEWAAAALRPASTDRFSNHAAFHFDLSVLDLYVAFLVGASVVLVPEGIAFSAARMVEFIHREGITVWYSVPSALILMMDGGGLLEKELPIHTLLFAGEPFPIKHLRRLRERWPALRLFNFYGPTETNVCTAFEVGEIDPERTAPVPIGKASSGDEVWAETSEGRRAEVGEEGELVCAGPTVMLGYWGQPAQGNAPYRTGDLVRLEADGNYVYVGRRDHMVKVRGHRIELGEVESALMAHPEIHEAAVAVRGKGLEARLVAFIAYAGSRRLGVIALKQHCAERLPRSMIIDEQRVVEALPRTGNGKVDRKRLAAELEAEPASAKRA